MAAALQPMAGSCFMMTLVLRAADMGASALLMGFLGTAFGIGFLPGLYLSKFAYRLFGERRSMIAGVAASAVIFAPWAIEVSSPWWFLPRVIVFGASVSLFWPTLEGAIGLSAPQGKLLRHLGNFNMAWCGAAAAGIFIAGLLYGINPYLPFYFSTSVEILLFLHLATCGHSDGAVSSTEQHPDAAEVPAWKVRAYVYAAWVANFTLHMAVFGSRALFPKIARELHIRPVETGAILSCSMTAAVIMFLILSLRYGWRFRKWFLFSMQAVGAVGLALITVTDRPLYFALAFFLMGLACGVTYYSSIYYGLVAAGDRVAKSTLHEMVVSLGILIGPVFFGIVAWMADDLRLPNNISALLVLAGIVLQAGILFRARETAS